MKPLQGVLYKVNGCSLYLYVKKVRYSNKKYTKCIIEFVRKGKSWSVFQTIKSAKIYHDKISHWEKVNQYE